MTKHGLLLTVAQLRLLRELVTDYDMFHLSSEEVDEAESIIDTLDSLIVEVTDPERYALPEVRMTKQGNARGYYRC